MKYITVLYAADYKIKNFIEIKAIRSAFQFRFYSENKYIHIKGRVSSKESNMDIQQRLPAVAMRCVQMLDNAGCIFFIWFIFQTKRKIKTIENYFTWFNYVIFCIFPEYFSILCVNGCVGIARNHYGCATI